MILPNPLYRFIDIYRDHKHLPLTITTCSQPGTIPRRWGNRGAHRGAGGLLECR